MRERERCENERERMRASERASEREDGGSERERMGGLCNWRLPLKVREEEGEKMRVLGYLSR